MFKGKGFERAALDNYRKIQHAVEFAKDMVKDPAYNSELTVATVHPDLAVTTVGLSFSSIGWASTVDVYNDKFERKYFGFSFYEVAGERSRYAGEHNGQTLFDIDEFIKKGWSYIKEKLEV